VIRLDSRQLETVIGRVGDTPFTATPYFFLCRGQCDVYADHAGVPRFGVIVPHTPCPDVYTFGVDAMSAAEIDTLAEFLASLETGCTPHYGLVVPATLVPGIRARRSIDLEVEGLCFTYREIPPDFRVHRPGFARRLAPGDAAELQQLPPDARFLYQAFGSPAALLVEGAAFGVFRRNRLVSVASTLVLTPGYGDVGVYTVRRHRHRAYATDCVEALFAHLFATGRRPLWRIGDRQKVAIYFAEKLEMEEIGTNGREVYVEVS